METAVNTKAMYLLKGIKHLLTKQQYKTIKGQILAGDDIGALKGINRIINKKIRTCNNG